ncbi:OmpA family protein [Janthinobacterium sp. SUN137]|uniref:OmpA family protein n=1 Tax=Janthinobacterium sp. SUN137 TaxID=3014789 RepID=UPI002712EF04|nr:OmpA family protein [Janthinobacterium sp. SUN137]MDO8039008.1 OmpA family protein [Janthinobacterium sp. SUN137]
MTSSLIPTMTPMMTTTMKLLPLAGLLAMGPAQAATPTLPAAPLAMPQLRISDQAVSADQQAYLLLQERIKKLNDGGVRVGDYYLSKAQCWLDVSFHEYTRNDRSAFPLQALQESAKIVAALEDGSTPNPGDATPLVNDATRLRDDLWAGFSKLRASPGFACAAQKVACGEVELAHAGNEYKQQGWRHANPYVQLAEDAQAAAQSAAASCPAEQPKRVTPPDILPPRIEHERITLDMDALFRFDKAGAADVLPQGIEKIRDLAARLKQGYVQIDTLSVTGHTDRLGSDSYNQALSERRALTVKQLLREQGIANVISAYGKGKAEPVAACEKVAPGAALIACLQPNRRVEIELTGIKSSAKEGGAP